jgi:hypothetical protein
LDPSAGNILRALPPPAFLPPVVVDANIATILGTGTPNMSIRLRCDLIKECGVATVRSDGTFSVQPTASLVSGTVFFHLTQIDDEGTESIEIAADSATILAPPIITSATAQLTSNAKVNGTATPGGLVKVYHGTSLIGTTLVASDSSWSVDTAPLGVGSFTLTGIARQSGVYQTSRYNIPFINSSSIKRAFGCVRGSSRKSWTLVDGPRLAAYPNPRST